MDEFFLFGSGLGVDDPFGSKVKVGEFTVADDVITCSVDFARLFRHVIVG